MFISLFRHVFKSLLFTLRGGRSGLRICSESRVSVASTSIEDSTHNIFIPNGSDALLDPASLHRISSGKITIGSPKDLSPCAEDIPQDDHGSVLGDASYLSVCHTCKIYCRSPLLTPCAHLICNDCFLAAGTLNGVRNSDGQGSSQEKETNYVLPKRNIVSTKRKQSLYSKKLPDYISCRCGQVFTWDALVLLQVTFVFDKFKAFTKISTFSASFRSEYAA
jgi:hypothetical protein